MLHNLLFLIYRKRADNVFDPIKQKDTAQMLYKKHLNGVYVKAKPTGIYG
jgi:hypothetical protein